MIVRTDVVKMVEVIYCGAVVVAASSEPEMTGDPEDARFPEVARDPEPEAGMVSVSVSVATTVETVVDIAIVSVIVVGRVGQLGTPGRH